MHASHAQVIIVVTCVVRGICLKPATTAPLVLLHIFSHYTASHEKGEG